MIAKRAVVVEGDIARIELQDGSFALIDAHLAEWAALENWTKTSKGYVHACRNSEMTLHRIVVLAPKGYDVDHINGDPLDNRRENLRICSRSQNLHNSGPRRGKRYKGTSPYHNGKWRVSLMAQGKRYVETGFATEEEAARAYDRLAREHHGPFARLNFPDEVAA